MTSEVLSDFAAESSSKFREIDLSRLMALSDDAFIDVHQNTNSKYLRDHGESTVCQECLTKISSHLVLIRFYESNLHAKCFELVYERERKSADKEHLEYWDRVARLF